jgi:hypothetical protein
LRESEAKQRKQETDSGQTRGHNENADRKTDTRKSGSRPLVPGYSEHHDGNDPRRKAEDRGADIEDAAERECGGFKHQTQRGPRQRDGRD